MNPFVNYNEDRECTSDPEAEETLTHGEVCDTEEAVEDAVFSGEATVDKETALARARRAKARRQGQAVGGSGSLHRGERAPE